ncbi:hypothetical protein WJX73_008437 [Symbiochloris irregularis]|uniref:Expansin-like EG45 domain-containing protein n=1 Tax=Symbiochloris irregularis TaxID=706552 RepID=A0AAW1NWN0_9CHLO
MKQWQWAATSTDFKLCVRTSGAPGGKLHQSSQLSARPYLSTQPPISPLCDAVTALSGWTSGIATNYGGPADGMSPYSPSFGTQEGACGYGLLSQQQWPYWSVAALSPSNSFYQAGPSGGCGECFEIQCMSTGEYANNCITGPNQVSIIVQITDVCPQCEANHIDLQALTYNKISPISTGRINMQYRRVQCVPPGKMSVVIDNNVGTNGWLRMFVSEAGGVGAVKQVQIRSSGSSSLWMNMQNTFGSAWEVPNAPTYPLDVNIISANDEAVTALQAITAPGQIGEVPTNVQFSIADPSDQSLTQPGGFTCAQQKAWGHRLAASHAHSRHRGACARKAG